MTIKTQIQALQKKAEAAIRAVSDLVELEAIKIQFLGKKGGVDRHS